MMPAIIESVESTLRDALGVPGLQHIRTKVSVCQGDEKTGALIEFLSGTDSMGVTLMIYAGGEFVLVEKRPVGASTTIRWTAEEVDPDNVTAAVLGALRRRVVDPVAS